LLSEDVYRSALQHLQIVFPERSYHSYLVVSPGLAMRLQALSFDYVVVRGRKYWALSRSTSAKNSQIIVNIGGGEKHAGELMDIIAVGDTKGAAPDILLGCVRWLSPVGRSQLKSDNTLYVLSVLSWPCDTCLIILAGRIKR